MVFRKNTFVMLVHSAAEKRSSCEFINTSQMIMNGLGLGLTARSKVKPKTFVLERKENLCQCFHGRQAFNILNAILNIHARRP